MRQARDREPSRATSHWSPKKFGLAPVPVMTGEVYDLAGLHVRSPVPLGAPPGDPDHVDVEIRIEAPAPVPTARPSTDVIAERCDERFPYYTFCRVADGVIARFYGIAEFWISPALDRVVCRRSPDVDPEYQAALMAGSLAAFLHAARGRTVLHASAVAVDGSALAFVGPSNQGKSTLAALLCSEGASLIADDVLVIDLGTAGVTRARRFGTELRVRSDARSIVDRFPAATPRRSTVDQRIALQPTPSPEDGRPLSALVLPRPLPGAPDVQTRRLGAGEAALMLGASQRIEGWRQPATLRRQFEDISEIVDRTPVIELTLPWGPPYPSGFLAPILQACGSGGTWAGGS
jgi:hypothetical protein